jgi:ribosome-binding factor A
MPAKSSHRMERINDAVHQSLAMLLLREVKDPRLQKMTLSGVEVSRDLGHAKVYYVAHNQAERAGIEQALKLANGFLRARLAKLCDLRVMPELHFHYDTSFDESDKVGELLRQALNPALK